MIRFVSAVSVTLLVLVSFELYNGVQRGKAQEQTLSDLGTQIAREREAIRVLKAEWSFLNQPERLQALARRHLPLTQTGASQIVVPASLPLRDGGPQAASPVIEAAELPQRIVRDAPLPRPKPIEQGNAP
jgi:hypothetical protein